MFVDLPQEAQQLKDINCVRCTWNERKYWKTANGRSNSSHWRKSQTLRSLRLLILISCTWLPPLVWHWYSPTCPSWDECPTVSMQRSPCLMTLRPFSSGTCSSGYTFSRYHLNGLQPSFLLSSIRSEMLKHTTKSLPLIFIYFLSVYRDFGPLRRVIADLGNFKLFPWKNLKFSNAFKKPFFLSIFFLVLSVMSMEVLTPQSRSSSRAEQNYNSNACTRPSRLRPLCGYFWRKRFRILPETSTGASSGRRGLPASKGLSRASPRTATLGMKFLKRWSEVRMQVNTTGI